MQTSWSFTKHRLSELDTNEEQIYSRDENDIKKTFCNENQPFHHANKTNNHLVLKAKPFRIREGPIECQSKTLRNATSRLPNPAL